jgi:homoserine dehydrogenase
MKKNIIKVGLIGLGTIGTGVVKVLQKNIDIIESKVGAKVELKKIADVDITRERDIKIDKKVLTTDAYDIINDPDIDIVIELVGGIEPALTFVLAAMKNKKHVVTANKAILARHWEKIMNTAKENGVDIYLEASVGGGIPLIQALHDGLAANNILSIYGIVNGTTNYILTKMDEEKKDFKEVLKDAQKKGFAEANPSFDVDGIDAAHKLAILTAIAFDTNIKIEDIYTEGISRVTKKDIVDAREEFGYVLKLLAIAKVDNGQLEVRVHPVLISAEHLLASVDNEYNGIYITGDAVGSVMLYGLGAGQLPTASAIISDIIFIARNISEGVAGKVPSIYYTQDKPIKKIRSILETSFKYYMRFILLDEPGVLAKIAGILGENGISIASVIQKERKSGDKVPVIITTYEAKEEKVRRAIEEIDKLPTIKEKTFIIRIEDI